MENNVQLGRFLSRREVSERLKVSLPTLDKFTQNGLLPAVRLGKIIRYRESDIENALKPVKKKRQQHEEGSRNE